MEYNYNMEPIPTGGTTIDYQSKKTFPIKKLMFVVISIMALEISFLGGYDLALQHTMNKLMPQINKSYNIEKNATNKVRADSTILFYDCAKPTTKVNLINR